VRWCSTYSGTHNGPLCEVAFVIYDTAPAMYQACEYNWKTKKCSIESKLQLCTDDPPASPPPPLPPLAPSPAPPPMPPTLCPLLEDVSPNMVSIRDKLHPTWCSDYDWSREKCELSYIRAGPTYTRCIYRPRTADDWERCEMAEGGWKSCFQDPPAPPAPPSMPSTCPSASKFGFTNDLRNIPVVHGFSLRTTERFVEGDGYPTTGYKIEGIHEMAVCDYYSGDDFNELKDSYKLLDGVPRDQAYFCKHSYQTDGIEWYPCLWRNVSRGGEYELSCSASPTRKLC